MRKIVETRSSLSNTMKDTSTIIRNPSLQNSDKGVMHDCASILNSIAKGTSCFHYFSHGASLHRHSFSRMMFTLVKYVTVYAKTNHNMSAKCFDGYRKSTAFAANLESIACCLPYFYMHYSKNKHSQNGEYYVINPRRACAGGLR